MTDLEITRLCAEEMGITLDEDMLSDGLLEYWGSEGSSRSYNPLHDDAQAMALVKKFLLSVGFDGGWACVKNDGRGMLQSGAYHYPDLNRAICECVAKMQASK